MEIKPIRKQRDYKAALAEIERVFEAKPGTPDGDRLVRVDEEEAWGVDEPAFYAGYARKVEELLRR